MDDGYELRAVTADGRFVSLKKGGGKVIKTFGKFFENEFAVLISAAITKTQKYGVNRQFRQIVDDIVGNWLEKNAANYGYVFTNGVI
jgi:hypothetical protein